MKRCQTEKKSANRAKGSRFRAGPDTISWNVMDLVMALYGMVRR